MWILKFILFSKRMANNLQILFHWRTLRRTLIESLKIPNNFFERYRNAFLYKIKPMEYFRANSSLLIFSIEMVLMIKKRIRAYFVQLSTDYEPTVLLIQWWKIIWRIQLKKYNIFLHTYLTAILSVDREKEVEFIVEIEVIREANFHFIF